MDKGELPDQMQTVGDIVAGLLCVGLFGGFAVIAGYFIYYGLVVHDYKAQYEAEAAAAVAAAEVAVGEAEEAAMAAWAITAVDGPDAFPLCAEVYGESWPVVVSAHASQINSSSWGSKGPIGGWGFASIDDKWCLFGVSSTTLSDLRSGQSIALAGVSIE